MKTIVMISDLHCGSVFGVTPPEHYNADDERRCMQVESWQAYRSIARAWKNPDVLLVNGDAIEGNQKLQGGAELITPDRNIQCKMAIRAINLFCARQVIMTYGSKYHVSADAEDFEYLIAEQLKAKIGGRVYFDLDGVVFDARHKVGSSAIPHGRATSLIRETMWNLIKEAVENGPRVHVVVRSHVHYHISIEYDDCLMLTTPALQLSRGRHGSRECTGETHWGAIRLTVHNGEVIKKDKKICKLQANRPKLIRIK